MKAVAMLSGGLDSRLAVRMIQEQGIEVEALNFVTPFCTCTAKGSCKLEAKKASEEYGVPLKVIFLMDEFIEIIKHARHGYGRGINPCLDCRILTFRKAGEYMREIGASFLVTGEVLGERPMSQRPDAIRKIEKESGLEGYIVRPLSANLLEESFPEKEGWVDRSKFAAIRGRSRKPQIELAEAYGMKDYPCAAGGCLLTDPDFAGRMRALLDYNPHPSRNEIMLLKVGRHTFLDGGRGRIMVGRNENENLRLRSLARDGDWLLEAVDVVGPVTLVRGQPTEADLELAAYLTAEHGKGSRLDVVTVRGSRLGSAEAAEIVVRPTEDKEVECVAKKSR